MRQILEDREVKEVVFGLNALSVVVIINGSRNGFFSSSQRRKQGDPLSPSLFVLAAECTNHNIAEAKATWYGGNRRVQDGHTNLIVESDTMLIIDMLRDKKTGNFRLNRVIEDTSDLFKRANVKFTHCFRS
ncbi:hypothetical protein HAX54_050985 [Datura stramonium]|uniref:RNase H type-1 domain-containing protein n=1 Tax=Datura stramonium TaxID=4076 RepID=A0ABS8WQS7_DATST|nr:hypothetical protein [Datura stramonium]